LVTKQAKLGALVCPVRTRGGIREYLLYTRLKQPFYGCQGFMTGKISYGEAVLDTAKRELKEETNLVGVPEIVAVRHIRVFDKKTRGLLEDKIFFYCLVKEPKGKLVGTQEGEYCWVPEGDLYKYVTNPFESLKEFKKEIALINAFDGQVSFEETDHYTDKF
jgi:ADP-ribose pyrophosphatase YjhB (NUDIX family)